MQPPDKLLRRSGVGPKMLVLEIGCGSGGHTKFAARGWRTRQTVCLGHTAQNAEGSSRPSWPKRNRHIHNIELVLGSATDLAFKDKSLDLVLLITVLEEIPNRREGFARDHVESQGRRATLAVTEFLPDPDYPLRPRLFVRLPKQVSCSMDRMAIYSTTLYGSSLRPVTRSSDEQRLDAPAPR